jgi:hypothetical protein
MRAIHRTLCAVSLVIAALPVSGQTFGEITGTLVDSSGAVVSGASVRATNNATSQVRQAETKRIGQLHDTVSTSRLLSGSCRKSRLQNCNA